MTSARLPPLWIADQVRNDGVAVTPSDPSVMCLFTLYSQCQALGQALIPLPSRERGMLACASMMAVVRHSPRKRESTGLGCTVIADLIRNPEGRRTRCVASSFWTRSRIHRVGQGRQQDKPTNSPSPLTGRGN